MLCLRHGHQHANTILNDLEICKLSDASPLCYSYSGKVPGSVPDVFEATGHIRGQGGLTWPTQLGT